MVSLKNRMRRVHLILPLLALAIFGLAACTRSSEASDPATLRVGLVPNQNPERLKAQYQSFRDYLSKYLGRPVELFVATDYAGVVEAMANDRLDMAYFGGLTYTQAEQRAKIYPIVTEIDRYSHTTKYHSLIITNVDSPIHTLEDVKNALKKGGKFAFGDISSTSGSLYPRIMLDKAGIGDFTNPNKFIYTGGHDATALAVQNGTVLAGGVEDRILFRLMEQGIVDKNKIRIVTQSDPIEGYPWAVRESLDKKLVEKIVQAFLEIKDPQLLLLLRAEGYSHISGKDYDYVRQEARRLGLLR